MDQGLTRQTSSTDTMNTPLVLLLSLTCACALADKHYQGHQVLELSPGTRGQILALEDLLNTNKQLDVWRHVHMPSAQVDIRVTPEQKASLSRFIQAHNITHRVKIPDVQAAIDNQMRGVLNKNTRDLDFNDYNRLEDIDQYLQDLDGSESLATLIQIGTSYEGRALNIIKLSTDPDAGRPSLFLSAAANPREHISTFVTEYGIDEEVTYLLDNLDFYLQPVFNPDGYEFTFEGDRLWRKTRSLNEGSECVGTDPNRNWGFEWGGDDDPCSDNYAGSEAFSEVEVEAVQVYVWGLPNVRAYLAYHSYGQLLMFPYGYTEDPIPDYDEVFGLLSEASAAIEAVHGETYTVGSLADIVGVNRGSSADYIYGFLGITYTVGVELRDTGDDGHLLPPEQIAPTSQENFAALVLIANHILDDVKHP